ncbi:Subtilisin-like protease SBT1.7 [Sesamum alatum]|uniref:Subtilisin-like protease SBT1.7 n=1 Tax=Sesamum alatum TaxID=300844 RepID=A0AAE1YS71_9LAMI|nr:Subtilisin-like protease SBT1.7 [Sesamum alatum]
MAMGTHTASTAVGTLWEVQMCLAMLTATAVGMRRFAHLAIYKVCSFYVFESDILAAMDTQLLMMESIYLSLSLGGFANNFYDDSIALGAYSAMEQGILVSCSAGNAGPSNFSLSNEAPWILTVGASTTDRKIRATAVLGDNQTFDGESTFQPMDFPPTLLPSRICLSVCEIGIYNKFAKGIAVKDGGGAAMISGKSCTLRQPYSFESHVLPATDVRLMPMD